MASKTALRTADREQVDSFLDEFDEDAVAVAMASTLGPAAADDAVPTQAVFGHGDGDGGAGQSLVHRPVTMDVAMDVDSSAPNDKKEGRRRPVPGCAGDRVLMIITHSVPQKQQEQRQQQATAANNDAGSASTASAAASSTLAHGGDHGPIAAKMPDQQQLQRAVGAAPAPAPAGAGAKGAIRAESGAGGAGAGGGAGTSKTGDDDHVPALPLGAAQAPSIPLSSVSYFGEALPPPPPPPPAQLPRAPSALGRLGRMRTITRNLVEYMTSGGVEAEYKGVGQPGEGEEEEEEEEKDVKTILTFAECEDRGPMSVVDDALDSRLADIMVVS